MLLSSRVLTPGALLLQRRRNNVPLWLQLVQAAEQAARDAGASLWYVPPEQYAPRAVNGPFVNSGGSSSTSGGTPAVGSGPIGWLRDAASGPLSSPNLVANGDFNSGNTNGWTASAVTLSVVNGAMRVTQPSAVFGSARQLLSNLIVGRTYMVSYLQRSVEGTVPARMFLRPDGYDATTNQIETPSTSSTTFELVFVKFVAVATSLFLRATCVSGSSVGSVEFDEIVVREIPGSHATQSTSANRPVLVAAPGAAAAAAGFGALLLDGADDCFNIAAQRWREAGWSVSATPTAAGARAWRVLAQEQQGFGYNNGGAGAGALRSTEFAVADYSTSIIPPGPHVVSYTVTDTFPTPHQPWVNGVQQSAVNGNGASANALSVGRIGSRHNGTEFMAGTVGALWVLPSTAPAMTAAQRVAIERLGAFIVGAPYPGL